MAISDVQIANMALANAGTRSSIESLDEASAEANACVLWYEFARKSALAVYDWDFARKRKTIAVHGDAAPDDWAYRYQYPDDCITARLVFNPAGLEADPVPYKVEISDDGTKSILTSTENAILIYTFDQTVTAHFSPAFVLLLSHVLAAQIAWTLTSNSAVVDHNQRMANMLTVSAKAQNANQGMDAAPRDASWVRER